MTRRLSRVSRAGRRVIAPCDFAEARPPMSQPADSAGEGTHVPEAERPDARTEEQEVAAGRTAATPVAMLGGLVVIIACAVVVVLGLVVLAFYLA